MKYSIRINAMSSLEFAINYFKRFYYKDNDISLKTLDYLKICLLFLENSIELFMKSILITYDPLSIYTKPNSEVIMKFSQQVTIDNADNLLLEDILLNNSDDFHTIGYCEALKLLTNKSVFNKRANEILKKLNIYRNSITHFSINLFERYDEFICCIIETFDVIYNSLYPFLINLNEVGDFFIEDGLFINSLYGRKPLYNKKYIYNNLVDFFDELEETAPNYIRRRYSKYPKKKIGYFYDLLEQVFLLNEFKMFLIENSINIEYDSDDITLTIFNNTIESEYDILSYYSSFHNSSIFTDDADNILFCIEHDNDKLYIYSNPQYYPSYDEVENYYQWCSDLIKNHCSCVELNHQNILSALKQAIITTNI